jgi:hypothetical protein
MGVINFTPIFLTKFIENIMDIEENTEVVQDELASLKTRADMLGISYHPSIKLDKLREKVLAHMTEEVAETPVAVEESEQQMKRRIKEECLRLVRVRITCMNPAKKEWQGEILSAGNSVIGTVKNYVPFNTEDGWHVPQILLNMMEERMCQVFTSTTDSRGNTTRRGKQIKEFAIEYMPALTPDELAKLAARQAATKSLED